MTRARLQPWNSFETVVFGAFLFWVACGLIFTIGKITPQTIAQAGLHGWLAGFINGCIAVGDPVLIILAAANTHLHAARQWTPTVARRWAVIILVASFAVESLGTLTGLPFGAYHYTDA